MKNRAVRDVMTTTVVLVDESVGFKDIVRRMEDSGVSALPVVDAAGHLVGIISEADLLLKEEHAREPHRRHLLEGKRRRTQRAKAEGLLAAQLMTAPVITIRPEASLGQAARLLHERRVKRLPVVEEGGKVVGIVSRADLLKVFMRPDEEIRQEVAGDVLARTLSIGPDRVRATVRDGVVTLEGLVDRRSLIPFLTGLVRGVDGVVGVEERLGYELDDVSFRAKPLTPWGIYPRA
jgi:CBS-domain-containing membrane protein